MSDYIYQTDVDQYELLKPLLEASYKEMQELSKKKPESPLNVYKVKMINRILEPIKELLKEQSVYPFLDTLDQDTLPSNSDVVLIQSQYIQALEMYYRKYNSGYPNYCWSIQPTPRAKKS